MPDNGVTDAWPAPLLPDDVTGDATGATTGTRRTACGGGPMPMRAAAASPAPSAILHTAGPYTGPVINQNAFPIGGVPIADIGAPSAAGVKGARPRIAVGRRTTAAPTTKRSRSTPAAATACMVDGSVRFLSTQLDGATLRHLVTRAEGIPVDTDSVFNQ